MEKALKDVTHDIKSTQTEVKALDKLLKLDPSNTELLAQKQQALADTISNTKEKLDTLKTAQEQAKQQFEAGTLGRDKYNALQQEIIKTELELKKLAEESAKTNTALKKIGDIGNTLTNIGDKISSVGSNLTKNITAPLAAIGTASVAVGMDFDAAMSKVKAISGVTGEDFDTLRDKAREMGAKTKFSATEAAEAFTYMAMAGWDNKKMLEGIEPVMNLAAASGEELAKTSDIVTDAMSAFHLPASEAAHFSDVLAAASNNANTNVGLLGESFQYIATSAGTYKFSIEDTAVALGLMANAGIKGTQAGNNLKNAMVNLTKPTEKQIKAMQQLGLMTTEYVTKVDPAKITKAQVGVEKATLALQNAQAKYNALLSEAGGKSTAAIAASNNLEKQQIKLKQAQEAVTKAQNTYDDAVKNFGANSSQAQSAYAKLQKANDNVRTATLNLSTAQEKYNGVIAKSSADSPKAVAARNAIAKAELNLKQANEKLTEAQKGTTKAVVGQNLLLDDGTGHVRSLDEIMKMLRATLGNVKVEVTDSNGEMRDFDDILTDLQKSGADLTQIQKLQAAATIFGKQNMAGMLAIVGAGQEDYDKLSNAVKNSTYNLDEMSKKLQDSGIDWSKVLNMDTFKSAGEAVEAFAKDVAGKIAEAQKNGESIDSVIDNLVKNYGLSAEEAKNAVGIVSDEMDKFGGTAKQTAEIMIDNLSGQLTILKSALQELAIQISDALTPTIRNIVSKVQSFVEKLQQMDEGTRNSIIKWGLFAAALGPVILIVGKVISIFGSAFTAISTLGTGVLTLWNQFQAGVGLGGQIGSVFSTLASGPVALIIAGIAALAAGFIYLWNTNEDFRNKCIEIWENVKTAFKALWDTISSLLEALKPLFDVVVAGIKIIWEQFCNFLAPILEGAFRYIASVLQAAVDILSGIIKVFKGVFTGDWETLWEGIKDIFSGVWKYFEAMVSGVLTAIKGLVSAFFSGLSALWQAGWTAIKVVFETVWNLITSFFSTVWDGLKAVVTIATGAIVAVISAAWDGVKTIFTSVWDAISGVVSSAWETMKNVVSVALLAIVELIKAAFNIITLPFQLIWENCKETITEAWNKIKAGISESLNLIVGLIKKIWNGIVSFLSPIITSIKDGILGTWDKIYNGVSESLSLTAGLIGRVWDGIVSSLSSALTSIKDGILNAWDKIYNGVSESLSLTAGLIGRVWDGIKASLSPVLTSIGDGILGAWNKIYNGVSESLSLTAGLIGRIWDNIKESCLSKMNALWEGGKNIFTGLWETIKGIIQRIKDCFSFEWSLPKIKLPHFKITGSFSLSPPSVPSLSIDWYKKAMDDAYILNDPTIFGMSGGKLLGGGEAGSEAVVGTGKLAEIVREAVAAVVGTGSTVIPVYIGQERIEEIVVRANQSVNYRSGGR